MASARCFVRSRTSATGRGPSCRITASMAVPARSE
jgi:hypothetical protein